MATISSSLTAIATTRPLSGLYPPGAPGGALQPLSGEIADATEWVTEVCSRMAEERVSMVLDMGGNKVLFGIGRRACCGAA